MSARRAVLESVDGMGKSTAAQDVALRLSENYPNQRITVVDSDGIFRYGRGALTSRTLPWLEKLEPHQTKSKLACASRLGIFTVARRMAEASVTYNSDLVIGVRDPYRIDPAAYSLLFGPSFVKNMSPASRLRLFNGVARAPHPDTIIHLHTDSAAPMPNTAGDALDPHEAPDKLQIIADELPLIMDSYAKLYGSQVRQVEALQPSTSDMIAAQLEPLASASTPVYIANAPASLVARGPTA